MVLLRQGFLVVTEWNSKTRGTDYPNRNLDPYSFQVRFMGVKIYKLIFSGPFLARKYMSLSVWLYKYKLWFLNDD